jgi:hypothetical protein
MDHTTQEPEPPSRPDTIEARRAEMSRRMQEALLDELERSFPASPPQPVPRVRVRDASH